MFPPRRWPFRAVCWAFYVSTGETGVREYFAESRGRAPRVTPITPQIARLFPTPCFRFLSRQQTLDLFVNHVLRNKSDNLVRHLAALEKQQSRNTANVVTRRCRAILVYIHLDHFQLAGMGCGHSFDYRPDSLAGTAPDGPKIHQNRLLALEHLLIKRRIAYFDNSQTSHDPPCCHCAVPL